MQNNLWKWLMQANAKHAFTLACCVLLAAAAASAWQFATAGKDDDALPAPETTHTPPPVATIPTSTGLLGFVNRQIDYNSPIPFNPFAPSLAIHNIEEVRRIREEREQRRNQETTRTTGRQWGTGNNNEQRNPNVTTVNNVQTQQAAPAATPPPVLTYSGFLTRADGTRSAAIHNSATRSTRFLTAGQTLAGATLVDVTHDTLTLRLPNGNEHTLPLRESVTLQ